MKPLSSDSIYLIYIMHFFLCKQHILIHFSAHVATANPQQAQTLTNGQTCMPNYLKYIRPTNAKGCPTEPQCVCCPPGTMMTNQKKHSCQFHVTLCYSCQPMSPSLIQTHCQDFYINSSNVSLGQKSFDGAIIKMPHSKAAPSD